MTRQFLYHQGEKVNGVEFVREESMKGQPRQGIFICPNCGKEFKARLVSIRNGISRSCGCRREGSKSNRQSMRGAEFFYLYKIWSSIMGRCYRPSDRNWQHYGGRGIKVAGVWADPNVFIRDIGHRPTRRHTLDRVENELGYSKENCRWATPAEQNRNRRDNVRLSYNGKTMVLVDWATYTGMSLETIRGRLKLGWSVADTLTKPVLNQKPKALP